MNDNKTLKFFYNAYIIAIYSKGNTPFFILFHFSTTMDKKNIKWLPNHPKITNFSSNQRYFTEHNHPEANKKMPPLGGGCTLFTGIALSII